MPKQRYYYKKSQEYGFVRNSLYYNELAKRYGGGGGEFAGPVVRIAA
jgi:hypothetical protein